jgi:hypothetical protein
VVVSHVEGQITHTPPVGSLTVDPVAEGGWAKTHPVAAACHQISSASQDFAGLSPLGRVQGLSSNHVFASVGRPHDFHSVAAIAFRLRIVHFLAQSNIQTIKQSNNKTITCKSSATPPTQYPIWRPNQATVTKRATESSGR